MKNYRVALLLPVRADNPVAAAMRYVEDLGTLDVSKFILNVDDLESGESHRVQDMRLVSMEDLVDEAKRLSEAEAMKKAARRTRETATE